MSHEPIGSKPHFTTRRGFITAAGFGVVSLYGLWAAYGAAPLRLLGSRAEESKTMQSMSGAPGEHGPSGGPSPEEFRRLTEQFIEANKLADGSVRPQRALTPALATANEHAAHGAAEHATTQVTPQPANEAVDVYLAAYQWGYLPAMLRLEAGVPYRFRMMAVDVAHGASLQFGLGGRIVRLRPGALVEQEFTFTRPGKYLLYCTVYCGLAHDRMQGRVIVSAPEAGS